MLLSMDPFQFLLFGKREKCRKQFCAFTAITAAAKSSASLARSWFLWLQEIVLAFFFELQHNPIYRRTLKTLLHHDCVLWHVSLTSHYLTLQDLLSELSKKANLDVSSASRGWGESHCWKSFKRCTNCPGRWQQVIFIYKSQFCPYENQAKQYVQWFLQDDSVPCHRAKGVQNWFPSGDITLLRWPVVSWP